AHLDDGDERAALLEWDEGSAEIVWLCHGALHRFVTGAKDAIAFAGSPIASSHEATFPVLGVGPRKACVARPCVHGNKSEG
ncbi:hypothetical protein, partial [Microvirga tunisiensis]|uniref:hypothetical protein n=1 Tax=Microvirga tunisiensis TaxID=2108360 RepID=UPI001AEE55BB